MASPTLTTLNDFVVEVTWALGNRIDINDKVALWLMDAYKEICMSYDLETLEVSVPLQASPGTDTYNYPADCRAIKSLTFIDPTQTSATPIQPRKKNIQVVRRYQIGTTAGQNNAPAVWAAFGTNFLVRPAPNIAYTIQVDYWQLPIINTDAVSGLYTTLSILTTPVLLPIDWFEILKQSAIQKGHIGLEELDKAQVTRQVLNGDPNTSKGWPGLIKERLSRNAAEAGLSDYGVRPRIRPYTSR